MNIRNCTHSSSLNCVFYVTIQSYIIGDEEVCKISEVMKDFCDATWKHMTILSNMKITMDVEGCESRFKSSCICQHVLQTLLYERVNLRSMEVHSHWFRCLQNFLCEFFLTCDIKHELSDWRIGYSGSRASNVVRGEVCSVVWNQSICHAWELSENINAFELSSCNPSCNYPNQRKGGNAAQHNAFVV